MSWNIKQEAAGGVFVLTDSTDAAKDPPVEVGRGVTDTDITYIALRNASGTKVYIYPDAAGTAITVSTTKP